MGREGVVQESIPLRGFDLFHPKAGELLQVKNSGDVREIICCNRRDLKLD